MAQIASVLSFIASYGIAHSDLKPCNILINPDTLHVFVIDWGACSFKQTKRNWCACSEIVSAPEYQIHKHCTSAADVFSLGLVANYIISKFCFLNKYRTYTEFNSELQIKGHYASFEFDDPRCTLLSNTLTRRMYDLVCSLCSYDKELRPTAYEVCGLLSNVYNPLPSSMFKVENKKHAQSEVALVYGLKYTNVIDLDLTTYTYKRGNVNIAKEIASLYLLKITTPTPLFTQSQIALASILITNVIEEDDIKCIDVINIVALHILDTLNYKCL
jgi:serine/threonine protein kinase